MYADNIMIIRAVGMRIIFGRFPMGRPACMADTAAAGNRFAAICLVRQDLQSALCLDQDRLCLSVPDRQTSRIISSLFQF